MTFEFKTGKAPGIPMQMGQTLVFGGPIIVRTTTKGFGEIVELDMGFYTNNCFIVF